MHVVRDSISTHDVAAWVSTLVVLAACGGGASPGGAEQDDDGGSSASDDDDSGSADAADAPGSTTRGTAEGDASTDADPTDASTTADATGTTDASGTTGPRECGGTSADCNGDPNDGCEVDLADDAEHCGACDHSCLGGTCDAQLCQPIVLDDQGAADGFVVDDTHVYYVTSVVDGTVMRVAKTGGTPEPLADAVGGYGYHSMQFTDSHLYWVEGWESPYTLVRVPKTGGARDEILPTMVDDAYVVDDERIYYDDGSLTSIAVDGGDVVIHDAADVYSIAADDAYVYIGGYSWIDRMDKRSGAIEPIVVEDATPWQELMVHDDRVFWNESYGAFPACATLFPVRAVDSDGTNLQTIATLGRPYYMAVSDDALYVAACKGPDGMESGVIARIPHGNAAEEVAQTAGTYPRFVAADDAVIYWVDGFSLYALAK